jgi:hypothetical protein
MHIATMIKNRIVLGMVSFLTGSILTAFVLRGNLSSTLSKDEQSLTSSLGANLTSNETDRIGGSKSTPAPERAVNLVSSRGKEFSYAPIRESSIEWYLESKNIDRENALVYRICSLTSLEKDQLRRILVTQRLIERREKNLRFSEKPELDSSLIAEDKKRLSEMQVAFESVLPEVAGFVHLFQERRGAARVATELVESIEQTASPIAADQAEKLFFAAIDAVKASGIEYPLLEADVMIADRDPILAAISKRNSVLIPAARDTLSDDQLVALMSRIAEEDMAANTK